MPRYNTSAFITCIDWSDNQYAKRINFLMFIVSLNTSIHHLGTLAGRLIMSKNSRNLQSK